MICVGCLGPFGCPADARVRYTDLGKWKLEPVSPQWTPEMVQFWNCMFMRVLSIVIRNHNIPAHLWRNSVLDEEDHKCGMENQDMLDVQDVFEELKKVERTNDTKPSPLVR